MKLQVYGFLLVLALSMSGCALFKVDGTVDIVNNPASKVTTIACSPSWPGSFTDIKLGLSWQSDWPKDEFIMTAKVFSTRNIDSGESLQFQIDRKKYTLATVDGLTDADFPESRQYRVNRAFVEKIVKAKKVRVNVLHSDGFSDSSFSSRLPASALPAFENFLKEYDRFTGHK